MTAEWLPEAEYREPEHQAAELLEREHAQHLAELDRRFEAHGPDPKPERRTLRAKALGLGKAREHFKGAILERDQGCCVHLNPADCAEGWQAHHVVTQQVMRRSRPGTEHLWDERVGMGVCGLAHRQHHSRVREIRLVEVPAEVEDFLRHLGYGSYLDRHYALPQRPVVA